MSGSPVSASPQLFLGGSSPGEILVRGGNCSRFCCHSTQSRGPRLTWGKGLGGHPPPPPRVPKRGCRSPSGKRGGFRGSHPSIHPFHPTKGCARTPSPHPWAFTPPETGEVLVVVLGGGGGSRLFPPGYERRQDRPPGDGEG